MSIQPIITTMVLALAWPGEARAQGQLSDAELLAALQAFNAHADFPLPIPSANQRKRMLAGEVYRSLEPPSTARQTRRAVGLLLTDQPRNNLWVSCQDPHFTMQDQVTEKRLSRDATGKAIWYGFMDLPRPFSDRQWIVDVWNNHTLAAATDGAAWEHAWRLKPAEEGLPLVRPHIAAGEIPPVTPELVDKAIYTPVNHGAWVVISLPHDMQLMGYHATSVVGGNIPDRLVAEFILSGMDKLLRRIVSRAESGTESHYLQDHEPIAAGDGGWIPGW